MRLIKSIPKNKDIRDGEIFEIISSKSKYTHSFFKYPARFIPEIPNWFLRNFTKEGDNILDCFCGSGTSLVEASLLNRVPLGIDFDPFSQLLTIAKTTQLSKRDISYIKKNYPSLMKENSSSKPPKINNLDHWFQKDNIKRLSNLIANIQTAKFPNIRIKNFYLITFAAIIRGSSLADDVSPKPYISSKIKKIPKNSFQLFEKEIHKNLDAYKDESLTSPYVAKIIGNDARSKIEHNKKINHVVTSPPYINAFDYVRVLRLENIWLGHFEDSEIPNHKKSQIGNEVISSIKYKIRPSKINIKVLDSKINSIYKVDKKRAHIVLNYFVDMKQNFKEIYSSLRKGGHFCIVVGDCSIREINIETHKFFILMLKQIGFKKVKHFSYKIKNQYLRIPRNGMGGIIKSDHVIVVKK